MKRRKPFPKGDVVKTKKGDTMTIAQYREFYKKYGDDIEKWSHEEFLRHVRDLEMKGAL